jgi:Domain of unknown function (DUF1844)
MPDKEHKPAFTVTDRRKFTVEGESRPDVEIVEEERVPQPAAPVAPPQQQAATSAAPGPPAEPEPESPPPPSAAEQRAQEKAYKDSTAKLDEQMKGRLGAREAEEFEVNFERFIASLYMSALVQLGLAHEQGGRPQVDFLGARHTIDTIAMFQEKTKGNLTAIEENLMRNVLYELRMAYLEVTNLITKPPQPGQPGPERK